MPSKKSEDWMLTTRTGKKLGYPPNQVSTKQFSFYVVEEMPSIEKMIGQDKVLIIYPTDDQKQKIQWEGVDQMTEQVDEHLYKAFLGFLEDFFRLDMAEFWNKYDGSTLLPSLTSMFPNSADEDI